MKKFSVAALLALAFVAVGCNRYVIKGQVDAVKDGDVLILSIIEGGSELVVIDSTVVKKGNFKFTGKCQTTETALIYKDDSSIQPLTFFIEPGTIYVSQRNGIQRATGTVCNNAYTEYEKDVNALTRRFYEVDSLMNAAYVAGDSLKYTLYVVESNALRADYSDLMRKYIELNKDNKFGLQMLMNNFESLPPERAADYLKMIEEYNANDPIFLEMKEINSWQMRYTVGLKIDDFEAPLLKLLPDNTYSLKQSATLYSVLGENKYVFLDFWASWCRPCLAELPYIKKAYSKYKDKGFEVVGLSVDTDSDNWVEAVLEYGLEWIHLWNSNSYGTKAGDLYMVQTIPTSFLLDSDGVVVAKDLRGEALELKLKELFGE